MNEDRLTAEDARKLWESEGNKNLSAHAEKKLRKIHNSIRKQTLKGRGCLFIGFLFGDIGRYCVHELKKEGYTVIPIRDGYYSIKW